MNFTGSIPARYGLLSFLLGVATIVAGSAWGQVTVRKTAGAGNPGLLLRSFEAPPEVQADFRNILQRCNWFNLVSGEAGADYVLDGVLISGTLPTVDIRVVGPGGKVTHFRQQTSSNEPRWLLLRTVDSLIRRLFNNPGLCASRIAFAVGAQGYKEIFTCYFDGTDARQLTHNRSISTEPSWGAAGAALVYTLYDRSSTGVVLIDMLQQRQRRISHSPGLNAGATLSPDGRYAALCLSRDRCVELYVLRIDNGQLTRLTRDLAVESSPCWSGDGRQICYVSDRSGKPQLYLVSAAGGPSVRLLSGWAEAVSPDWSAVSNKICYSTRVGSQYALAVVDMGGTSREPTIITRAAGDWEAPSWAPDGRHVVCSRQQGRQRQLCMVDTWYGRVLPNTQPADHSLPAWSDLF
jgi:TolB protein